MPHYQISLIPIDDAVIEGLRDVQGKYWVPISQVMELIGRVHTQANMISVEDFHSIVLASAFNGNKLCQIFLMMLGCSSLYELFAESFGETLDMNAQK